MTNERSGKPPHSMCGYGLAPSTRQLQFEHLTEPFQMFPIKVRRFLNLRKDFHTPKNFVLVCRSVLFDCPSQS